MLMNAESKGMQMKRVQYDRHGGPAEMYFAQWDRRAALEGPSASSFMNLTSNRLKWSD